jgi:hypothetical protein
MRPDVSVHLQPKKSSKTNKSFKTGKKAGTAEERSAHFGESSSAPNSCCSVFDSTNLTQESLSTPTILLTKIYSVLYGR